MYCPVRGGLCLPATAPPARVSASPPIANAKSARLMPAIISPGDQRSRPRTRAATAGPGVFASTALPPISTNSWWSAAFHKAAIPVRFGVRRTRVGFERRSFVITGQLEISDARAPDREVAVAAALGDGGNCGSPALRQVALELEAQLQT